MQNDNIQNHCPCQSLRHHRQTSMTVAYLPGNLRARGGSSITIDTEQVAIRVMDGTTTSDAMMNAVPQRNNKMWRRRVSPFARKPCNTSVHRFICSTKLNNNTHNNINSVLNDGSRLLVLEERATHDMLGTSRTNLYIQRAFMQAKSVDSNLCCEGGR